jgi:putative flavoprotein involved in K+ transport
VGSGNSGLQIAAELSESRSVSLSTGRTATELPLRWLGRSIFWWLAAAGSMSVPVTTPLGRRASQRPIIIGEGPRRVARRYGVRLVPRVVGASSAGVELSSGEHLSPAAVVWATGYRPDFAWIEAPVLDTEGRPVHRRGMTAVPGLHFLGLSWLHTRGSGLIGWVGRDALFLSESIRERSRMERGPDRNTAAGGAIRAGHAASRPPAPAAADR